MDTQLLVALFTTGGTLGGAVIGLGGSWLAAKLTRRATLDHAREMVALERRRFAEDRLWDARRISYTAIVAHVRAVRRLAARVDSGYNGEGSNAHRYDASEERRVEVSELWTKWRECRDEYEQSRLLLSDRFADTFESIEADLLELDDNGIPPEIAHDVLMVFTRASARVLDIARREVSARVPSEPDD